MLKTQSASLHINSPDSCFHPKIFIDVFCIFESDGRPTLGTAWRIFVCGCPRQSKLSSLHSPQTELARANLHGFDGPPVVHRVAIDWSSSLLDPNEELDVPTFSEDCGQAEYRQSQQARAESPHSWFTQHDDRVQQLRTNVLMYRLSSNSDFVGVGASRNLPSRLGSRAMYGHVPVPGSHYHCHCQKPQCNALSLKWLS